MNELALFAGAGGGLLASKWLLGWRTVCYVEREPYCVEVIKARIQDGLLDDAPIWDDVRTFDGTSWRGSVDIVTAGFPCQPFSVAGKQAAADDERNGWPDTIRIIREVQPRWCLLENVRGLLSAGHGYFGTVLGDLAESGFDVGWKVLSAEEVGAPHRRDRLWIVAHANCFRCNMPGIISQDKMVKIGDFGIPMFRRGMVQGEHEGLFRSIMGRSSTSEIDGTIDGVASRVDRLRALGNGQVPLVAATAWNLLLT